MRTKRLRRVPVLVVAVLTLASDEGQMGATHNTAADVTRLTCDRCAAERLDSETATRPDTILLSSFMSQL